MGGGTKTCLICGRGFVPPRASYRYCCLDLNGSIVDGKHHELRSTYQAMIDRCYDPNRNVYAEYGGRGIMVNERWRTFSVFVSDMGPKPTPTHTLDRIDLDANYSAENCRWATLEEQRINRRRFKNSTRKYKGVSPHGNKWKAEIRYAGQNYYLGLFSSEDDAARAYNEKLKEFYPDNFQQYENKVNLNDC